VRELDLASLDSVRGFAARLSADHPAIDLLVNNAGVALLGPRRISADGFELQLGTNMLGHFALTGLLIGNLAAAREARVVSLSSITHKNAHLDFDDLMFERDYRAVLPQLRAATEPGVRGGRFFGPSALWETRGRVTEARLSREAADPAVGRRLWAAAEELTGVSLG
jgi:hypothetical protein